MGDSRYCIVAVYYADKPDLPQRLSYQDGKILIFSTLAEVQSALPRLGGKGRKAHWLDEAQEFLQWTPARPNPAYNAAVILTQYDPYNIAHDPLTGVGSETRGLDWRHHILFNNVASEVLVCVDGQEAQWRRQQQQRDQELLRSLVRLG